MGIAMEFITKGETIHCVRTIKNQDSGKDASIIVASFDAHVNRIAPHVVTKLSPEEVKELELWLKDRTNLQIRLEGQSIEDTILEALPILLKQATQALKDADHLDSMIFHSINERLKELTEALENALQHTVTSRAGLKQMQNSEEQKERLDTIKKDIENK